MIDNALCETDNHSKGVLWEDVAAYVLNNVAGLKITGRRIRAGAQEEIQRLAANNLSIICITASDLRKLHSAEECRLLILNRWQQLLNATELSSVI